MQAILNSPEAKLAILNALVSLGLAVFVLVQETNARPYVGRLSFRGNYYRSVSISFGFFAVAHGARALHFAGFAGPLAVQVAGSFTVCFLMVAAIQLYGHLSESRSGSDPGALAYAVGLLCLFIQLGIGSLSVLPAWFRAAVIAILDALALVAMAWALRLCREESWLRNIVLVGLPAYGAVQFLAVPGYVHRMDLHQTWLAEYVLHFEFLAMALAVLGKFVIAFGLVLVNQEFIVRDNRERLKTKERFVTLGALTTTWLHRL
jgi:hypothetical protein